MKRNSWSEISIGNSCAHAQTLARARLASTAWGLALSGMLSSGCILLGSDNDTGQNTVTIAGTGSGATEATTTDPTNGPTTVTPTTDAPTTEGSMSDSQNTTNPTTDTSATATTTDSTGTGTGTTTGTGTGTTDATGTGMDTGTDTGSSTDTGTGTTGGGGLGEGEVCQDNPDGCAPGLLCCYPCGIPDCMNKCIKPDPNTQMCPLFP